jgi:hypothetical protein
MTSPTLPPPELLHIERDGAECYVTANDGLERICTMSRAGDAQRLKDARMIVRTVNARALMVKALQTATVCATRHGETQMLKEFQEGLEAGNYDYNL